MKNVALYGAGQAAHIYFEKYFERESISCFTTDGDGYFKQQKISPISTFTESQYAYIVIASDYYIEMLQTLESLGVSRSNILIFNYEKDLLVKSEVLYPDKNSLDTLFGVYDLTVNHPNYDIVNFLVRLEQERLLRNLNTTFVYIVPSVLANGSTAKSFDRYDGLEEVKWRIERLVMSSCGLLPSCRGVSLLDSRCALDLTNKEYYPADYDQNAPQKCFAFKSSVDLYKQGLPIDLLKAPSKALSFVSSYLQAIDTGRKVITISMREYEHEPKRNTQYEEWKQFLVWLDKSKYCPIIIRDTAKAFQLFGNELDQYEQFSMASIDVQFRLALYELSWLNLTVDTGPCALMIPSTKIAYINFKPMIEDYIGCRPEFAENTHGIACGEQALWAAKNQKYIWQAESFELLKKAFLDFESVN
jgi:hypothetical protein